MVSGLNMHKEQKSLQTWANDDNHLLASYLDEHVQVRSRDRVEQHIDLQKNHRHWDVVNCTKELGDRRNSLRVSALVAPMFTPCSRVKSAD